MNLCATTFAAVIAVGALAVAAAPASAEPGAGVRYAAGIVGDSVVTTIDNATFELAPGAGSVLIRDPAGQQILALPLAFELEGVKHPIVQSISDDARTLVLSPDTGLRPVASPVENQLALTALAGNMSNGTLLGTVGGFVIGALVGAVIGLGSCLVVGPGCLATAPAAIMAFATGGGVLGTLALGGIALADGLWKYLTTLHAAPGESAYADRGGLLAPGGTGTPDANLRMPPLPLRPLLTGSATGSGKP